LGTGLNFYWDWDYLGLELVDFRKGKEGGAHPGKPREFFLKIWGVGGGVWQWIWREVSKREGIRGEPFGKTFFYPKGPFRGANSLGFGGLIPNFLFIYNLGDYFWGIHFWLQIWGPLILGLGKLFSKFLYCLAFRQFF